MVRSYLKPQKVNSFGRRFFLLLSAAIALCVATSANASTVRYKQYMHPSSDQFGTFDKLYLDGVMEGLETANSMLVSNGSPPLYCMPPKLAITEDQAEDIMLRTAKKVSNVDDYPISILLLVGLRETFPCGGQSK
jgi:hypothetical protein